MTKFDKFIENAICVAESVTELMVAWQVCKVSGSAFLGVLSLVGLSLAYSFWALLSVGVGNFDVERSKAAVKRLQQWWLLVNTTLYVVLSQFS